MRQYTFGLTVEGDLEDVRERVIAALGKEGFGVLTEIDVSATMKAKLDKDVAPYRILGACNPTLAHEAISTDPRIGALLPCNVVVRQVDEGVAVDFMDPYAVLTLVDLPEIEELATEVRGRLEKVKAALAIT
jgi:uncharacterized protein (DUF302 family)